MKMLILALPFALTVLALIMWFAPGMALLNIVNYPAISDRVQFNRVASKRFGAVALGAGLLAVVGLMNQALAMPVFAIQVVLLFAALIVVNGLQHKFSRRGAPSTER